MKAGLNISLALALLVINPAQHTQAAAHQPINQQAVGVILTALHPAPPPRPDFDKDVLNPLRKAQTEAAALAAQQAAEAAQAALEASMAVSAVAPASVAYAAPNDSYKDYIYEHESGNDPSRWNSSGCYGLGQDCNNVVYHLCGADYACEDNYFTQYMTQRYNSWFEAYEFWNCIGYCDDYTNYKSGQYKYATWW